MDYTREASYTSFLINEMMEHVKMEAAIKEAVILAEGREIPEFNIIHESFFDKVKETWDKFTAFIKRIWAKFTEKMMSTFDVDKPYLEKYRDIILKKPVQFTTVSMINCNIERIVQAKLEAFDYNLMKEDLKDPSKLAHRFISDYDVSWDTDDDFVGWCKKYFCNGSEQEEPIDPSKLDMASMFDYCITWKDKMKPALEKDIQAINNSTTKAYNLIKNVPKKKEEPQTTNTTQASGTATTQTSNTPPASGTANTSTTNTTQASGTANSGAPKATGESFLFVDDATYSFLYEADVKIDNKDSSGGSVTSGPTVSVNQTAGGVVSKTTVDATKTKAETGDDAYEEVEDAIKCYTKIAGGIASSKLTASQWAYKEYMKIIKAHVQSHIAVKEPVADEAPGKGQTYTAPQGQQQGGEQGQQAAGSGKQPPKQP